MRTTPIRFRSAALCFSIVATAAATDAQWESTNLNGTEIQLGMDKADVLTRLARTSTLKEFPNGHDNWCVLPLIDSGEPWADCDNVVFSHAKLVGVDKLLRISRDESAASLFNDLYSQLAAAEKLGLQVSIHTQLEGELADSRVRSLSVFIGQKHYEIFIHHPIGRAGSFVQLDETLWRDVKSASQNTTGSR